ncbi:MAG: hypothetical protein R6U50_12100 [Desulfobacterales bacterium]
MYSRNTKENRMLPVFAVIVVLVAGIAVYFGYFANRQHAPATKQTTEEPAPAQKTAPVIDYNELETDPAMKAMMADRKAEFGLKEGIDIIAKPDESLKVGDTTVSMREIIDKIRLKEGRIVEGTLEDDGTATRTYGGTYGIYIVQPEDNIWNIHFNFLQDYFRRKGITLSPLADEPTNGGYSSGVGKVLKFSENIVHVYNLKEKKMDTAMDLIYPLSKIIVYNMDRIFSLLDRIDYGNVNRIQFDGETLWIPAEQ